MHLSEFRKLNSLPIRGAGFFVSAVLVALIILGAALASVAAPKTSTAPSDAPDVLVLVLSGLGPFDMVSINYASDISTTQASADVAELAKMTGWVIGSVETRTKSSTTPGSKPTTSATFQTPKIVNIAQGTLPLEPFINVLKRFKHIDVNFLMNTQFNLKGPKDFEDDRVAIRHAQNGTSIVYRVLVKRSDFTRLNLPVLPVKQQVKERGTMPTGARILLVLGVAIMGAVLVYLAVAYSSKRRKADD